jgi:hypothetical protein
MAKPAVHNLAHMARQAGYQVLTAEQLRPNRWLLILKDSDDQQIALLAQARPLINSADVLDLYEIVRLRRLDRGILWAIDGTFSPAAHRTHQELANGQIRLCTALPPASKLEHIDAQSVGAAIKSSL